MRTLLIALLTVVCGFNVACASLKEYRIETVAANLDHPWCIAFLPGGDYLVSLRSGALRRISGDGEVGPALQGTPDSYVAGQGGYFDVLLDRDFARNKRLYLAFAHGDGSANATRVVRAKLAGNALQEMQTIFTVAPTKGTSAHYGGRLLQLDDGSILLTTGDGFQYREASQDTTSQLGKVVRFGADGSLPDDNPFSDSEDGDPAVWTYGHRNPQGLAIDRATGRIFLHEHGPRGGDEINLLQAGKNYGWPAATHGINYSGAMISPHKSLPGMVDPLHVWVPSIAPSGFAIYRGDKFPAWQGRFFVGALVDREVRMLTEQPDGSFSEQTMFSELRQRIRDVREGPDGYLYLLTDGEQGQLLRIVPAGQ